MLDDYAPDGAKYAGLALLAGLLGSLRSRLVGVLGVALAGFVLQFYRDPDRQTAPVGVASPADGRVSVIREEDDRLRVGVYMSATDVHVNRAPLAGTVREVTHRPGAYKPAFSKDSDNNEQLQVDFEEFSVVLIAGWFARRIHPYVEVGDTVEKGERIGHISFGSRADVLLPPEFTEEHLVVEEGDRVYAGQTTLAVADEERERLDLD